MNMKPMSRPLTREQFERRVYLFSEALRSGRIGALPSMHLADSLLCVRRLPNGRLDLLSVNESARLLVNTFENFGRDVDASSDEKVESASEDYSPGDTPDG